MSTMQRMKWSAGLMVVMLVAGCTAPNVDFSSLERPPRADELNAYEVFVGSWAWEARVLNSKDPEDVWKGKASWGWALDKRCLQGRMNAKCKHAEFESVGIWSFDHKSRKHIWWMFNNWGYPQNGTAKYDEASKTWTMKYTSVGLDGTGSSGTYQLTVVDNDTLEWTMNEWDSSHIIKKLEMTGSYRRLR